MIKHALLSQNVISGLGNIYVDESLHTARIHPQRRANELRIDDVRRLMRAIKQVLVTAVDRATGSYRSSRFRVYDREGARCLRRGCGGSIKRRTQGGRSTFYCPVCQR